MRVTLAYAGFDGKMALAYNGDVGLAGTDVGGTYAIMDKDGDILKVGYADGFTKRIAMYRSRKLPNLNKPGHERMMILWRVEDVQTSRGLEDIMYDIIAATSNHSLRMHGGNRPIALPATVKSTERANQQKIQQKYHTPALNYLRSNMKFQIGNYKPGQYYEFLPPGRRGAIGRIVPPKFR